MGEVRGLFGNRKAPPVAPTSLVRYEGFSIRLGHKLSFWVLTHWGYPLHLDIKLSEAPLTKYPNSITKLVGALTLISWT